MNKDFKFVVRDLDDTKDWSTDLGMIITEKTNNGWQFYNERYTTEEFEEMYQVIHNFRKQRLLAAGNQNVWP